MRVDGNFGSTKGYQPNRYGEWLEQPDFREPPLSVEGAADHWNHRIDEDYYSQPGALYRLMSPVQRQVLIANTVRSIGSTPADIQLRHLGHCLKADAGYGRALAEALHVSVGDIRE